MCRLFGLTAGTVRVNATFWLLDAPDSLQVQSHRNADGAGIGYFGPEGEPVLDKQPDPAFSDQEFLRAARQAAPRRSWRTSGGRRLAGGRCRIPTRSVMNGRVMAHNGGFGELSELDAELGRYARLVLGDTDSERYFALITKETDARGGDVGAGIAAAASWIAGRLPVSSLNVVVAAPGELWALRYPGQHALHILERPGDEGLHVRSATSSVHMAEAAASVVIASEALDGETGWRMLEPGELVHVRPDLSVASRIAISEPPAHLVPLPGRQPEHRHLTLCSPDRIRTGVTALRGRRPRPLDDGAVRGTDRISTNPCGAEMLAWPARYRLPPRHRSGQPAATTAGSAQRPGRRSARQR